MANRSRSTLCSVSSSTELARPQSRWAVVLITKSKGSSTLVEIADNHGSLPEQMGVRRCTARASKLAGGADHFP